MEENDECARDSIGPEPIEKGGATIVQITEGWDVLQFDPPLRVDWAVYKEDRGTTTRAYIIYDFGMEQTCCPLALIGAGWSYGGINKDSSIEEVIKSVIRYDLFHAFTHYCGDPNYTYLHWALYGNLKNRCKVIEKL